MIEKTPKTGDRTSSIYQDNLKSISLDFNAVQTSELFQTNGRVAN